jgi:DNA-binding Lrp family transcriptional regulator
MPSPSRTRLQRDLLQLVQADFPLVPRPYQHLAEQVGATEKQVIEALGELLRRGVIRELAPVFATARLGYSSTLAAMAVPEEEVDRVAALVNAYPEVTHNYLRDHHLNLWFTVTAPWRERVVEVVREIAEQSGYVPLTMPTRRQFKIKVVFDFAAEEAR